MRDTFRVTDAMRSDDPFEAAEAYIAAGLKLVILHGIREDGTCTCRKSTCQNPGKHPIAKYFPNGVHSATSDIGFIEKALKDNRDANLAASLEGLTVLDIDGPRGKAAIASIQLPWSLKVKSKRGVHRWYLGEHPGGTIK